MKKSLTIPKDPVYPPGMDWLKLRREGIRHIEQLGSDIWTDYNLHDPGITLMEGYCYADTDLSNRAHLNPADLFAGGDEKSFFTAAEILSSRPVTALDIRKILIDIPGVKNAWVEQLEDAEVRFMFINPLSDELIKSTLEPLHQKITPNSGELEFPGRYPRTDKNITSFLEGIYKCQTEKEKEKARSNFRTLMINMIKDDFPFDEEMKKAMLVYMAVNYFPELLNFIDEKMGSASASDTGRIKLMAIATELRILNENFGNENFEYDWARKIGGTPAKTILELIGENILLSNFIYGETFLNLLLAGSLRSTAVKEDATRPEFNLFVPQGIYAVTLLLDSSRSGEEKDIIDEALQRLHAARNLGEDFSPNILIAEKIKMGIDLKLDIDPEFDLEEVMSAVYNSITQYLAPNIPFYSLEEMMNRFAVFEIDNEVLADLQDSLVPDEIPEELSELTGKIFVGENDFKKAIDGIIASDASEEYYGDIFILSKKHYDSDPVFRGPILEHGFIDDTELLAAKPRQTVFKSDLYTLISAIEGVREIEMLEIFKCDEPDKRRGNWCLAFDCRCLPELEMSCSTFRIMYNGRTIEVDKEKLQDFMDAHPEKDSKQNRKGLLDLKIPAGRPQPELAEYTSIQEDLPRTYKVGSTGISTRETILRQAQAKQLKAYILFYDQLLANYLVQLANVKNLLSVNAGEPESFQPLYDVPGISDLLLDYALGEDWEAFKADKENAYIKVLKLLAEGNETDKKIFRSKVLDYLLARFGEHYDDATEQLFRIEKPVDQLSVGDYVENLDKIILGKQNLLRNIPSLGRERASSFNYHSDQLTQQTYWNTLNNEGVKRRVCALLGIENATRHTITCEPTFVVEVGAVRNPGTNNTTRNKFEFYIKSDAQNNQRLLVSTNKFTSIETAEKASLDFLEMAVEKSGYGIAEDRLLGFWANIPEAERTTDNAMMLEPKENPDNLEQRLKNLVNMASGNCEDDSFHIIEHLLLRPRNDAYTEILRPMICCPENLELMDPYSFWVTVVLPEWTSRFNKKNPQRKEAFKQLIGREMPANLSIRFCVLSRESMFRFEKSYNNWLKILCSVDQEGLAAATDELVQMMNSWDDSNIEYF